MNCFVVRFAPLTPLGVKFRGVCCVCVVRAEIVGGLRPSIASIIGCLIHVVNVVVMTA